MSSKFDFSKTYYQEEPIPPAEPLPVDETVPPVEEAPLAPDQSMLDYLAPTPKQVEQGKQDNAAGLEYVQGATLDPYELDPSSPLAKKEAEFHQKWMGYEPTFWQDPKTVARWYNTIKAAPPGTQLPEFMTPEFQQQVEQAYKYFEFRNNGEPWGSWDYLNKEDQALPLLAEMPVPPREYLWPGEERFAEQQAATSIDAVMQGQAAWAELPEDQRKAILTAADFNITQYDPMVRQQMLADPNFNWDALPAWQESFYKLTSNPYIMSSPMALAGWNAGSVAGPLGKGLGALLGYGLGVVGGQEYDPTKGVWDQPSVVAGLMKVLNVLSEGAEQTVGYVGQVVDASLAGAGGNQQAAAAASAMLFDPDTRKAAFEAGRITYEYGDLGGRMFTNLLQLSNQFAVWDDVLKAFASGDREKAANLAAQFINGTKFAKSGQDFILGYAQPVDKAAAMGKSPITGKAIKVTDVMGVLQSARHDIEAAIRAGQDPSAVILQYMNESAQYVGGQVQDITFQSVADPLNAMEDVSGAVTAGLLERASGGQVDLSGAPRGSYEVIQEFGAQVKTNVPVEKLSEMNGLARWLAGVNEKGEITAGFAGLYPSETLTSTQMDTSKQVGLFGAGAGKDWFRHIATLTPEARARTAISMTMDNLGTILNTLEVDEIEPFFTALSKSDMAAMKELAGNVVGSAEFYTVLPMLQGWDRLGELAGMWEMSAENRGLLSRLSDVLGVDAARLVEELGARDGATRVWEQVRLLVSKSSDPTAKTLLEDMTAGRFTVEDLQAIGKTFNGPDALPWHPGAYKAMVMDSLGEHAAKWSKSYFGLKPDSGALRLAHTLKGAQSLLLLGFNPGYLINNMANNVSTRASSGLFGFMTPGQMRDWTARFGITPERMREGVGISGETTKGASKADAVIRDAMQGKGALATADSVVRSVNDKMAVFANASKKMEGWESAQAYTIGMQKGWDRFWKRGSGFRPMDAGLVRMLREIDPSLPDLVYRAVEGGMNQKEIESRLAGTAGAMRAQDLVTGAAQQMNMTTSQAMTLLKQAGVLDALENYLSKANTLEKVDAAFRAVEKRAQDWIDIVSGNEARSNAQHVSTRIRGEGAHAVFEVVLNTFEKINDRWIDHYMEAGDVAAQMEAIDPEFQGQIALLWGDWRRRSISEWKRTNHHALTVWKGVIDGVGLNTPEAQRIVAVLAEQFQAWNDAYSFAQKQYDAYYDTWKGKFSDRASLDARMVEMESMKKRIDAEFQKAFEIERVKQEQFRDLLAEQMGLGFGDEVKQATLQAYQQVIDFRKEMVAALQKFRRESENLYGADRRAAKAKFYQDTYLPRIVEMRAVYEDGVRKVQKVATGQAPDRPIDGGDGVPPVPPVPPKPKGPSAPSRADYVVSPEGVVSEPTTAPAADAAPAVTPMAENVWAIAGEAGISGLDQYGNPVFGAKLDVIKFVKKWGGAEGGAVKRFADVTPELMRKALDSKKAWADAQEAMKIESPKPATIDQAQMAVDKAAPGSLEEHQAEINLIELQLQEANKKLAETQETLARSTDMVRQDLSDKIISDLDGEVRKLEQELEEAKTLPEPKEATNEVSDTAAAAEKLPEKSKVQGHIADMAPALRESLQYELSVMRSVLAEEPARNIYTAIKDQGGLDPKYALEFFGAEAGETGMPPGFWRKDGFDPYRMARFLAEDGWPIDVDNPMDTDGVNALRTLIERRKGQTEVWSDAFKSKKAREDALFALDALIRGLDKPDQKLYWNLKGIAESLLLDDPALLEKWDWAKAWGMEDDILFRLDRRVANVVDEALKAAADGNAPKMDIMFRQFIDVIAETPQEIQGEFVRVLDADGNRVASDETYSQYFDRMYDELARLNEAGTAEMLNAQAELALADQQATAEMKMTRELLREKLTEAVPNATPEQVDMTLALLDARAEAWAKQNNSTPSEWYATRIADVVRGGSEAELNQGSYRRADLYHVENVRKWYQETAKRTDWVDAARAEFGLTADVREAGWILPDGKMLDFSGKREGGTPYTRAMDHRDISRVVTGEGTSAMVEFASQTGSIRFSVIDTEVYIDLMNTVPTDAQIKAMKRAVSGHEGITFDIDDARGNVLLSGDLPARTGSIDRIVADAKRVFEGTENGQDLETHYGTLFQQGKNPVWYSRLAQTIEAINQPRMSAEQLRGMLQKAGVKADELKWTGFDEFVAGKKTVTKEEALNFLRENMVQVEEVTKGGAIPPATKKWQVFEIGQSEIIASFETQAEAKDYAFKLMEEQGKTYDWAADMGKPAETKFGQYVLPGGENYREVLFKLPMPEGKVPELSFEQYFKEQPWGERAGRRLSEATPDELRKYRDLYEEWRKRETRQTPTYTSPHWSESNVLAHTRLTDRVDADGKRVLFVEEVQSDWHQAGREKGYQSSDSQKLVQAADARENQAQNAYFEYKKRMADYGLATNYGPTGNWVNVFRDGKKVATYDMDTLTIEPWEPLGSKDVDLITDTMKAHAEYVSAMDAATEARKVKKAVPDAPFAKTWHELVMKRVLRMAAEEGYDRVAWTTGEQQAARYDLAKQVDHITVTKLKDGQYNVQAISLDRSYAVLDERMPASKIADVIGKDAADKVLSSPKDVVTLRGDDLKVGGSGMRGFYDQILPAWMDKYAKKWGAKTGETKVITTPQNEAKYFVHDRGDGWRIFDRETKQVVEGPFDSREAAVTAAYKLEVTQETTSVHSVDVTPAMRESVMQGQPLFQTAYHGSPHKFDKFTLDHMGTGEGVQAYGWGLYFADSQSVAEYYRVKLSEQKTDIHNAERLYREYKNAYEQGVRWVKRDEKGVIYTVSSFEKPGYDTMKMGKKDLADTKASMEKYKKIIDEYDPTKAGQLYKVELPDENYLLWDRPLSEQPQAVKDALKEKGYEIYKRGDYEAIVKDNLYYDTGESVYRLLSKYFDGRRGDDRLASMALKDAGIQGIKYLDGSSRSKGEGNYNYVIFDAEAIKVLETYYQGGAEGMAKGGVTFLEDGRAVIHAFEAADLSTIVHELGHIFRRDLSGADLRVAEEWAGVKDGVWTREAEEKFARGFERYLADESAPSAALKRVFAKMKDWLVGIYRVIAGSPIDVKLTPEIKGVFDRLLAESPLYRVEVDPAKRIEALAETTGTDFFREMKRKAAELKAQKEAGQGTKRSAAEVAANEEAIRARAVEIERLRAEREAARANSPLGIDEAQKAADVAEIAETDFFRQLKADRDRIMAQRAGTPLAVEGGQLTAEISDPAMLFQDEEVDAGMVGGLLPGMRDIQGENARLFDVQPGSGKIKRMEAPNAKSVTDVVPDKVYEGANGTLKTGDIVEGPDGQRYNVAGVNARGQLVTRDGKVLDGSKVKKVASQSSMLFQTKAISDYLRGYEEPKFDAGLVYQTSYIAPDGKQITGFPHSDVAGSFSRQFGELWNTATFIDKAGVVRVFPDRVDFGVEVSQRGITGEQLSALKKLVDETESGDVTWDIIDGKGKVISHGYGLTDLAKELRKQTGPTMLFQSADPRMPLGGIDQAAGFVPEGAILDETYAASIKPLLDAMRAEARKQSGQRKFSFAELPPEAQAGLNAYVKKVVKQDMPSAKLATVRYGESLRDFALLNYNKKYGFDKYVLDPMVPYQFWTTRTGMNTLVRLLDKPAMFATLFRTMRFMSQYERDLPDRLKGKMKVEVPFLPEWMGGSVYIDPLKTLFPILNFMQPFEQMQKDQNAQVMEAERVLQEWAGSEKYSQAEISQAVQTRSGSVWDAALAEASLRRKAEIANPMDFMATILGPAWYLTTPYKLAMGQGKEIGQLPITKTAQAIQTATAGTWAEPLGNVVGLLAKPETFLRDRNGLPQYGEYGEYYIDRQIANLVAEGLVTPDQAKQAMIERSGDVYAMAEERVRMELMMRVPGGSALYAGLHGGVGDMLKALPTSLFGAGILPEGELKYRGLKEKWNAAWDAYDAGDTEAIGKFFEDHPEYEVYLMKGQTPDERLRNVLTAQIWDSYMSLTKADRRIVTAQLGPTFQHAFLNSETRSPESLDVETLARWSLMLGNDVPETKATEQVVNTPQAAQPQLEGLPAGTSAAIAQYDMAKAQQFPLIGEIQNLYFASSDADRAQVLTIYPQLREYWEWRRTYIEQHPESAPFLDRKVAEGILSGELRAQDYGLSPDQAERLLTYYNAEFSTPIFTADYYLKNATPLLMESLSAHQLTGQPLTEGAYKELEYIWKQYGMPGESFTEWLDVIYATIGY